LAESIRAVDNDILKEKPGDATKELQASIENYQAQNGQTPADLVIAVPTVVHADADGSRRGAERMASQWATLTN
jgi:hypothetical protein